MYNIDFEGIETLETSNSELSDIYPADVKISRDVFSVYELKRKFEDKKTLILDPEYQREKVWTKRQKSELIESILMGIPLPVMYFAEDKYGKLQVIDGRQRLETFFEFMSEKSFRLTKTPILNLEGKRFYELDPMYQTRLEDYQIIVYIIKPQTPDRIKFDIFDRVNRGGTPLNKQEMRNALYQGKSTRLLKELANYQEFKVATDYSINTKRMKDRYLILRFIAFYMYFENKLIDFNTNENIVYKSDIDAFLGKTMDILNHSNDDLINELKTVFKNAMQNGLEIFGRDCFRIPSKNRKRPVNMALFESLGYLLSFDISKTKKDITKRKVNELFKDNYFIKALTEKIDSSNSVEMRFSKMKEILRELESV
jgi:hypothetical protein